jgi:hypothetical protein
MDRGEGGPLLAPSAYFMKSPPVQYTDSEAKELVDAFIRGDDSEFLVRPERIETHGNGHAASEELDLDRVFEPKQ